MRTTEEQIASIHRRAGGLSRKRERAALSVLFVISAALLGTLLRLSIGLSWAMPGIADDAYTAASLLDKSIGGYVAVGVLAFMAGAVITILCISFKKSPDNDPGGKGIRARDPEKDKESRP